MALASNSIKDNVARVAVENFIAKAIKRPGQLHRDLGVPEGQKIGHDRIASAAHRPGKTGMRARFALALDKMRGG